MADSTALPVLLLIAFGAAVVTPLLRPAPMARALALAAMLAILALAMAVFVAFDPAAAMTPFAFAVAVPGLGAVRFAVDGYNVYLLLLTALLFPAALLSAWPTREAGSRLYLACLLALEAGLLATFLAQDLLVLFVFWEAVLIPMVLAILVFGGAERRRAAWSFFLYTMAGSVPFLAAVIVLGAESHAQTGRWSFDLAVLEGLALAPGLELFVFAAIALACLVKSPLVPFHSWLPLAYREAPASATALMAGVMSKMGAYGFLRLAMPLCPDAAGRLAPLLVALAVLTLLYGASLALIERDFKRLAAWASLSHTGYIVLGLFAFAATSIHGAMVQMLSHGLVAGGLFLVLGLLEQRRGADYLQLDALATRAPRLAVMTMLFVLASLALPLTSSFTAELLVLLGSFGQGLAAWRAGAGSGLLVAALLAALGVVLGAAYMLRFARRLVFREVAGDAGGRALPDLSARELVALAPLVLLVVALGVSPAPFMAKTEATVAALVRPLQSADDDRRAAAAGAVAASARGAERAR